MIRFYPDEKFKEFFVDYPLRQRYAVSNRGRLLSFNEKFEDGTILKGGSSQDFRTFRYKIYKNGKVSDKAMMIYKLVAELFIPKTSEDQKHVIHLDHSRNNDVVWNLRWATYEEMMAHRKTNPKVQGIGKKVTEIKQKADGAKLTSTQAMRLKKLIMDPNRKTRLKILAKQFNISEMQLFRIKRGENWGHLKV